jgi:uncharacterized protein (TIGR02246 family)
MHRPALNRLLNRACRSPLALVPMVLSIAAGASGADKVAAFKSVEAAIHATADEFVKAFNRGDAKAVAALWTAEGTLADDRGEIFKGRKAIENEYAAFFKAYPGAKMEVAIHSINFTGAAMAVEDGEARVIAQHAGPPMASRYTAVHFQEGGKWLMASVRETAIPVSSNAERLHELSWLIGSWKTKGEGPVVETTYRWIANRSFIQREYAVRQGGLAKSSGTQIIGYDAQAGRIRSWSFDSSGGHGTSLWSATPEGWRMESTGTLPDGTPTSSRELLIRVADENDVFGWRSFDRKVGQASLPDTREVVLDRVPEKR